jgi:hypothetical protein
MRTPARSLWIEEEPVLRWPQPAQLLAMLDRVADAVGLSSRPLSAAELIRRARHRTGLTDLGDEPFLEPLEVLARSYHEEARLSVFGRLVARWDALRFLSNLLMLKDAEKAWPDMLARPIEQPIFITGMPRSGTTFLHHLLAQDPANRVVRCWETIYPYPARVRRQASPERRSAKVDRQLNGFARLVPEVRSLHPMTADAPQECTEINAHLFTSLRFDTTHRVPSYRRWLDRTGHLAAYRFHRRFLKHLQHQRPGRWVLKSPDHVFALDAIRQVYPEACFIFMHRSPLEVLPSVARLTEVLRSPFTRHVDRHEIGRQVGEQWARGAAILLKEAKAADPRCMHIRFDAFIRNPLGAVSEIYRRFGLTPVADGGERFRKFAAQWPQGRKERDKAQLERYGFAVATERRRYQDYMAFFGL